MKKTKGSKYFGYEDYEVTRIGYSIFESRTHAYNPYYYWWGKNVYTYYPIDKSYINNGALTLDIKENPQVLIGANKVYVHSSCTIPRTSLTTKYKRCLNAVTADVIVIPNNSTREVELWENTAVFINEEAERIYICNLFTDSTSGTLIKNARYNTKLIDLVPPVSHEKLDDSIKNARLTYYGPTVAFNSKSMFLLDYIIGLLPKEKIVFQDTIMASLGDTNNVPTFENMVSISEMLSSQSVEVIDLGLKTLAALDYMRYPQSVKTILMHSMAWRDSPARGSTAVKYMLKELDCYSGYYIGYKERYISQEDYNLTEKLIKKLKRFDDADYLSYCYNLPFVYVDEKDIIHPRVKEEQ